MGTHAVVYMIALAVVSFVSLVMAIDDVGIIALFLTFGLALPLFFLATLIPYMLAFLPLVLAIPRRATTIAMLLVSLAICAAWATVPAWRSEQQADSTAKALSSADSMPTAAQTGRTLEIRRPERFSYELGGYLPDDACETHCRHLLLSGQLDWVRIVTVEPATTKRGNQDAKQPSFLVAAEGAGCAAPGESVDPGKRCVVFGTDGGQPASLVATVTESRKIERLSLGTGVLFRPQGERIAVVTRRDGAATTEVLRNTTVFLATIAPGTPIAVRISGMSSGGFEFVRRTKSYNDLSFGDVLKRVGYAVDGAAGDPDAAPPARDWREPPAADQSREVLSLLDLTGEAPFNDEQKRIIDRWIMNARQYKDWPGERIDFLLRIFNDRRVEHLSFLDQIFERNPAVTEALLPVAITRLEMLPHGTDFDKAISLAYHFARVDAKYLAPYAQRITKTAVRDDRVGRSVLTTVGRLGIDPLPFLLPMTGPDGDLDLDRVRAACYADLKWSSAVVPHLRALLTAKRLERGLRRSEDVIAALVRHGDEAFVTDLARRSPEPRDVRLVESAIRQAKRWPDTPRC